jgi:hypothetical protein
MTGTKVLLILLILIVVLFIVCILWGALGSNASDKTTASTFDPGSHSEMGNLANLFGSPSPKLKPSELIPNPPPLKRAQPGITVPADKFILRFGDQPTTFDISPDSGHKLRRAIFTETTQGCATIAYNSADGSGSDLKLDNQHWPADPKTHNSTRDSKDPRRATFQVLSAKGHLSITLGTPDCAVQLE